MPTQDIFDGLDRDTKDIVTSVLDGLLKSGDSSQTKSGFGKPCRLVYPPRPVACANCVIDPNSGRSTNRPRSGAAVPFASGQPCPLCSGSGKRETENYDDIVLKCDWEMKKFLLPVPDLQLRVPYSVVQTKGFMSDVPKVMKAAYLLVNTPISGVLRQKYKLLGEPGDPSNIIQGRYFVALWERVA